MKKFLMIFLFLFFLGPIRPCWAQAPTAAVESKIKDTLIDVVDYNIYQRNQDVKHYIQLFFKKFHLPFNLLI